MLGFLTLQTLQGLGDATLIVNHYGGRITCGSKNTVSMVCSPILEDLDISEAARALWEAPFAVLSHNRFEDDEPKFTYANQVRSPLSPHWPCRTTLQPAV